MGPSASGGLHHTALDGLRAHGLYPERMTNPRDRSTYERAGVAAIGGRVGFRALIDNLRPTLANRSGAGRSMLDFGYYASVLDIHRPNALAISTDGIGTKAIVAEMMDRFDTIGIDCVAMNANDVLCVGAEPIAMLDYIAVDVADDRLLAETESGWRRGECANISIPRRRDLAGAGIIRAGERGFGFSTAGTCGGSWTRGASSRARARSTATSLSASRARGFTATV